MDYTSIKVGQLPTEEISGSDFIPHEVNGLLKKATITDLAAFIGANDAVGFRAVSVENGGTLPTTDTQEFILVGPGTYNNVGGGSTITVTEELNALVSNGTYWFVGVEIPIDAPPGNAVWGEIVGTLSNQTDLQSLLNLKADLVAGKVPSSQLPSYVDDVVEVANYAALPGTGETGKIYVTIDTGNIYRWSGSAYIRIADESPVWGIITGTLSNQTDLQAALDGKFDVPTGDTTQYIAGDGSLITFPVAWQAGTLVRQVKNSTGSTLTKGTVVYINGASGNKPTVTKAIATGDSTSAQTFGLIQADIANNETGYVVCVGDIIGLNTSAFSEGTQLYLSSTTAGAYTSTKQYAPAHLVYIGVVTRSHATLGQIEVKIQNGYELDEIHDVAISSVANNEVLVYESSTSLWKNKTIGTVLGYTPANDASVVKLTGDQTISGKKSFNLVQTGYNLSLITSDIFSDGTIESNNGMLRLVNNTTSADLFRLESDGIVFAKAFKKDGGTSSEFLMADGSVSSGLSGTTNYIPKFTSSSSIGNSLIYEIGSTIGIGTTSPFSALHIKRNASELLRITRGTDSDFSFDLGASNDLYIKNNGIGTTPLTILSSGNVGIGTITPSTKLEILGSNSNPQFLITRSESTSQGFSIQAGSGQTIFNSIEGTNSVYGAYIFNSTKGSTTVEHMRIDTNGNVGIGVVPETWGSLNTALQLGLYASLYDSSGSTILGFNTYNNGTANKYIATGSLAMRYIINGLGHIWETAPTGTADANITYTERMRIDPSGNVGIGTTSPSNRLHIYGTDDASSSIFFERPGVSTMTIGSNYIASGTTFRIFTGNTVRIMVLSTGNVGIGTETPSYKLHVNGSVAGTSAYVNLSDKRHKKDILPIENALDKILALNGVTFNWDKESTDMNLDDNNHIGLLAQDVEQIIPQAVVTAEDENETKSVAYTDIVPVLIEAIKELKAEIELLKNK